MRNNKIDWCCAKSHIAHPKWAIVAQHPQIAQLVIAIYVSFNCTILALFFRCKCFNSREECLIVDLSLEQPPHECNILHDHGAQQALLLDSLESIGLQVEMPSQIRAHKKCYTATNTLTPIDHLCLQCATNKQTNKQIRKETNKQTNEQTIKQTNEQRKLTRWPFSSFKSTLFQLVANLVIPGMKQQLEVRMKERKRVVKRRCAPMFGSLVC